MSRSFERSFKKLVGIEGGYSNQPSDPGGKTKFGITEEVARSHGYKGDMKSLSLDFAKSIYKESYWDINRLSSISNHSESVAYKLFDVSVNCGSKVAGKFFQRALNAFNKNEELYPNIKVDGIIGELTFNAFDSFRKTRGVQGMDVLLRTVTGQQISYYISLTEKDEKFQTFVYGWILQRT